MAKVTISYGDQFRDMDFIKLSDVQKIKRMVKVKWVTNVNNTNSQIFKKKGDGQS